MLKRIKKLSKFSLLVLLSAVMVITTIMSNNIVNAESDLNPILDSVTINGNDKNIEIKEGEKVDFDFGVKIKMDNQSDSYTITMPDGVTLEPKGETSIVDNETDETIGSYTIVDNKINITLNEDLTVVETEEPQATVDDITVEFNVSSEGTISDVTDLDFGGNTSSIAVAIDAVAINEDGEENEEIENIKRQDISHLLSKVQWDSNIREDETTGELLLYPGSYYTITLTFEEQFGDDNQFDESGHFIFKLPKNMSVFKDQSDGTFEIIVNGDTKISGNKFTIDEDGNLLIDLFTGNSDEEKAIYEEFKSATDANFNIWFKFTVSEEESKGEFDFNDDISKSYRPDDNSNLIVEKTHKIDYENGIITYTVSVESLGKNENIRIKDIYEGSNTTLLTFNNDITVTRTKNGTVENLPESGYTLITQFGQLPLDDDYFKDIPENKFLFASIINEMENGEKYEFTYTAKIDYSQGSNKALDVAATENDVFVISADVEEKNVSDSIVEPIRNSARISKNGHEIKDPSNFDEKNISWTITINGDGRETIGSGFYVKDSINATTTNDSSASVKYDNSAPLHVYIYDSDGKTVLIEFDIEWDQVQLLNGNEVTENIDEANGWRIDNFLNVIKTKDTEDKLGESFTELKHKIDITYATIVDVSKAKGDVDVTNNAEFKYDHIPGGSTHGSVGVQGALDFNLLKNGRIVKDETGATYDEDHETPKYYIEWDVIVKVPNLGLDSDLIITDTLPYKKIGDVYYSDTYNNIVSVQIADINDATDDTADWVYLIPTLGEPDIESTIINSTTTTDSDIIIPNNTLKWTFNINDYKDNPNYGGNGTSMFAKKMIKITYRSLINYDWYMQDDLTSSQYQHTNKVVAESSGITRDANATVTYMKKTVTKTLDKETPFVEVNLDGKITRLPKYTYTIILTGLDTDDNVFDFYDEFNGSIFKYYGSTSLKIKASKSKYFYSYDTVTISGVTVSEEETGKLKFSVNIPNEQKVVNNYDDNGNKISETLVENYYIQEYNYYKIEYSLIPIDLNALQNLADRTKNNEETLNIVDWDGIKSQANATYEPKEIIKTKDETTLYKNRRVSFNIEFNPFRKKLSTTGEIVLKDSMESLRLDPFSLIVKADGIVLDYSEYSYEFENSILTIIIPNGDSKQINITYDAIVIGDTSSEGDTITFKNHIELENNSEIWDSQEGTYSYDNGGAGSASTYQIELYKYVAGSFRTPLEGAQFRLESRSVKNPEEGWKEKTDNNGESIFTTDENGRILITSKDMTIYNNQGEEYRFTEIASPKGYTFSPESIYFSFSQNPVDDNTYMKGEVITVANNKENFHIVKLDEVDNTPIEGAKFTLYSDQDCTKEVQTAISDAEGKVSFKDLRARTYYLKETEAVQGYQLPNPNPVYEITLKKDGETLEVTGGKNLTGGEDLVINKEVDSEDGLTIYYATITNQRALGSLTIEKTSEGTLTPDRTKFTITCPDGSTIEVRYDDFEDGKITIPNLEQGEYKIEESLADVIGYTVTVTGDETATIDKENLDVTVSFTNTYEETEISTDPVDLVIFKVDQDFVPHENITFLEGATFQLRKVDYDTKKETIIDTQSGGPRFEFTIPSDGYYVIEELEAPEGYDGIGIFNIEVEDGLIYYINGYDRMDEAYDSFDVVNTNNGMDSYVLGDEITEEEYYNWLIRPSSKTDVPDKHAVDTGDHTDITSYMTALILSFGAMLFLRKKKQEA